MTYIRFLFHLFLSARTQNIAIHFVSWPFIWLETIQELRSRSHLCKDLGHPTPISSHCRILDFT